jgi:hypothetical protein
MDAGSGRRAGGGWRREPVSGADQPPPTGDDIANRLNAVTRDFIAMVGRLGDINDRIAAQPPPVGDRPGILASLGMIQSRCMNVNTLVGGMVAEIGRLP